MNYSSYAGIIALIVFSVGPTWAFADEPVITGATNITAEATSTSGASVTFSVTASDTSGSALTPACTPRSGSLFALGTTTVTCTATSAIHAASTTTAHFDVSVLDTTPPVITPPANQAFASTGALTTPAGLALATASDRVDQSPAVTHFPTSFAIGTSTITWTATDASGNSASATSKIFISGTVPVHFDVETATTTVFKGDVNATPCQSSPGSATTTVNGFCLFGETGVAVDVPSWDPVYGAFINSIGGDSIAGHYWGFFLNGDYSNVGISGYLLKPNDTILWALGVQPLKVSVSTKTPTVGDTVTVTVTGFDDANSYSFVPVAGATLNGLATTTDRIGIATFTATSTEPIRFTVSAAGFLTSAATTITASAAPTPHTPAPSGGGGALARTGFDIPLALSYLTSKQHADGSFDSALLSDWAALAFAASDTGNTRVKLRDYLRTASPALSSPTDFERHAMALESLGINPYSGTPRNYIAPIVNAFDGTQIGDASLDNDDIFALFPLLHAGYSAHDPLIQKTTTFILSRQAANGSWDSSVDLTAAAVQALAQTNSLPGVPPAITKAEGFLRSQQRQDGGFGSSFSTSWVLQAIPALGESQSAWAPGGSAPLDNLAAQQQPDGGVEPVSSDAQTRVWATEYAIPAALGRQWDSLLQSFPQEAASAGANAPAVSPAASVLAAVGNATTTTATSTPLTTATSTPLTATSTPLSATSTPVLESAQSSTVPSARSGHTAISAPHRAAVQKRSSSYAPVASPSNTSSPPRGNQTAAAGIAVLPAPAGGTVLADIWHTIVSFFGRWF